MKIIVDKIPGLTSGSPYWYAYQKNRGDNDWSYGSYDWKEAVAWLEAQHSKGNDDAIVATIDEGDDPICIDETRYSDL